MQHSLSPDSITEYVDDRVLAQRTSLSRSYWQALRQRGEGPQWRKIGRRVIYRWTDVVAWLDAHATRREP